MLSVIGEYAKDITCIITIIVMLVKPLREAIFGIGIVREGHQCLLRSEIVRIYYRHLDERKMRQYEFENLTHCYKAYRKLGGNSFVEHIYAEMQGWKVVQ